MASQVARFLVSQAIMLALAGVPAIYIHSLIGSHNDVEGVKQAGYARAINRRKVDVDEITRELDDPMSFRAQVFDGYTHLIQTRMQSSAFHPNGKQQARTMADGHVLILERTSPDHGEHILFNISGERQTVDISTANSVDMLTGTTCSNLVTLDAYQTRWLKPRT